MADIIQLLPESIANQIAAGEVIQRPASVVKELLENSIDAGATSIQLLLKDSGKTSIQVIDNGIGMTETDARMSLERHATSKIQKAEDLFEIKTMGFRGEAMASIASIAQMEITTRTADSDIGVKLDVAASVVKNQDYCQAPVGTTITVKNLFFNIPARRKFLKSDPVELKYILEEFKRVALAHPMVKFKLIHNSNELYHLNEDNLRKRVINIFGKATNEHLVPIDEYTDVLNINGFIGKPQLAKKNRGNQYLFVNNRFIKSGYLNHAIKIAYSSLIREDQTPFYVLFLEVDPKRIDINVHPTKTEIKFEDERLIYQYLKVSIQHGLGKYQVTPSIDFEAENTFNMATGFSGQRANGNQGNGSQNSDAERQRWTEMYQDIMTASPQQQEMIPSSMNVPSATGELNLDNEETVSRKALQLHNTYIIHQIKSGYMVIHQQHAHQRIIYEKLLEQLKSGRAVSQQLLFPITIDLNPDEFAIAQKLIESIKKLGYSIEHFGQHTFLINGIPTLLENRNHHELILDLIEASTQGMDLTNGVEENIASRIAAHTYIKKNKQLTEEEISQLIDDLFACEVPFVTPSGKKCFVDISLDVLEGMF